MRRRERRHCIRGGNLQTGREGAGCDVIGSGLEDSQQIAEHGGIEALVSGDSPAVQESGRVRGDPADGTTAHRRDHGAEEALLPHYPPEVTRISHPLAVDALE